MPLLSASSIRVGGAAVSRIYRGSAEVWSQPVAPSSLVFAEDFSVGAHGAAITAANTGYTSVTITTAANGSVTFNDANYRSALVTTNATGTSVALHQDLPAAVGVRYRRFQLIISNENTIDRIIGQVRDPAGVKAQLRLNANRTLSLRNGFTAVATTTTVVPLNQLVRVEWALDAGAGTQRLRLFTGNNWEGTVPTEEISAVFDKGTFTNVQDGLITAAANTEMRIGNIADDDAAWVGPVGSGSQFVPGTSATTLFGSSAQVNSGETWPQAFDRVNTMFGGIDILRHFNSTTLDPWSGDLSVLPAGALAHDSFKVFGSTTATKYDKVDAWLDAAREGSWLTWYHEPGSNMTGAEFQAEWRPFYAHCKAHPRGGLVIVAPILTRYHVQKGTSTGTLLDFCPLDMPMDGFGMDGYNTAWTSGGFMPPSAMLDPGAKVAADRGGIPWSCPEIASQIPTGKTDADRAAWITDLVAYARNMAAPPTYLSWFNSTVGGGDWTLDAWPDSAAAWRAACSSR